jgi:hypothetical protein
VVFSLMSGNAPALAQSTLAWDKTFPKSGRVEHRKVSFYNRLGLTLVADLAYGKASEPKELVVVPGAGHVDLYDRVKLIPWDKLRSFFTQSLASKES